MAWTYAGDPAASDLAATRFLIQDTDVENQLFEDAEVNYWVNNTGSVLLAAAELCRVLATKYARRADEKVGDLSLSFSQLSKQYAARAASYQTRAETAAAAPFAGGTSLADKRTREQDSDRVQPAFARQMHDNPTAQRQNRPMSDIFFNGTL